MRLFSIRKAAVATACATASLGGLAMGASRAVATTTSTTSSTTTLLPSITTTSTTSSTTTPLSGAAAPTVTAVNPNQGPTKGGTAVTVSGTGFEPAGVPGVLSVDFGSTPGTQVAVQSDSQLTVVSPSKTAGTFDVTVTTALGTSTTGPADRFLFVAPLPVVSSLSPSTGSTSGGSVVTIVGTGFSFATAVDFGNTAAQSFQVISDTEITATSPAGSGSVYITVTTAGGVSQAGTQSQFTYVSQGSTSVNGVSPSQGTTAGGTTVTVTGSGFELGTSPDVIAVDFGSTPGTQVAVQSDSQLTVVSPEEVPGIVNVTVQTATGTSPTGSGDAYSFIAPTPTVSGLSPATGSASGGTTVTVTGSGFEPGGVDGVRAVDFGSVAGSAITVVSDTQLTAVSPSEPAGTVDVTVSTSGGTSGTSAGDKFTFTASTPPPSTTGGYWMVAGDGGIFTFGTAGFFGSMGGTKLVAPVVSMAATPDGKGYWMVGADGGVFTFGDAPYEGSTGQLNPGQAPGGANAVTPAKPIVSMAATPDGKGYWMVGADGGVFTFGDALYFGSLPGLLTSCGQGAAGACPVNVGAVVSMVTTPDGKGYWMATGNGMVFFFGDATDQGSASGLKLAAPIVSMAATPDGKGYWLVGADGGVFTFGDAPYEGSTGQLNPSAPPGGANAVTPAKPVVGLAAAS